MTRAPMRDEGVIHAGSWRDPCRERVRASNLKGARLRLLDDPIGHDGHRSHRARARHQHGVAQLAHLRRRPPRSATLDRLERQLVLPIEGLTVQSTAKPNDATTDDSQRRSGTPSRRAGNSSRASRRQSDVARECDAEDARGAVCHYRQYRVAPVLHRIFVLHKSADDAFLTRVVDSVLAGAPLKWPTRALPGDAAGLAARLGADKMVAGPRLGFIQHPC